MFLFQQSQQAIKETPAKLLKRDIEGLIQQVVNKLADMDWERVKGLPPSKLILFSLTRLNNDLAYLKQELEKMTPDERSKLTTDDLKKIVVKRPKN